MPSSRSLWPGYELEVDQRGEWVESQMPEPDPLWRFVDANGHGHFYGTKDGQYPTLRWVALPCTMGHGDDCTSEGYYECSLCGEQIRPGTRAPQPSYITGPRSYRLTVRVGEVTTTYAFGDAQLEAVQAAVSAAVQDVLSDFVVEVRTG